MEPLDGIRLAELEADQARQEVTFVQAVPTLERRLTRRLAVSSRRGARIGDR